MLVLWFALTLTPVRCFWRGLMRMRDDGVSVYHSSMYNKPHRLLQASLPFAQEELRTSSCLHPSVSFFLPNTKSHKSPIVPFPSARWRRPGDGWQVLTSGWRWASSGQRESKPSGVQSHPLIKASPAGGGGRARAPGESHVPSGGTRGCFSWRCSPTSVKDVPGKVTPFGCCCLNEADLTSPNVLLFLVPSRATGMDPRVSNISWVETPRGTDLTVSTGLRVKNLQHYSSEMSLTAKSKNGVRKRSCAAVLGCNRLFGVVGGQREMLHGSVCGGILSPCR